MKKLIMLSVFALGTITASASNEQGGVIKNDFNSIIELSSEKIDGPIGPIALKYNYKVEIWKFDPYNFGVEDVCKVSYYNCLTEEEFSPYNWIINENRITCGSGYNVRITKTHCLVVFP